MRVNVNDGQHFREGSDHWVKGQGKINDLVENLFSLINHVLLVGLTPK